MGLVYSVVLKYVVYDLKKEKVVYVETKECDSLEPWGTDETLHRLYEQYRFDTVRIMLSTEKK